ncbi:MAG: rhamnulokinase [Odoribacter sp.]|nr:rhamnulokinase [Odoribacter sp.]
MRYIAADFGAGSGRVIVGTVRPDSIELEEIHRFPNRQIRLGGVVYWDFLALFEELKNGLRKAFRKYDDIVSIGVDTWGVDFGLIDKQGHLISNPVCYRDARTEGMLEKAFKVLPKERFYALTGNQFMEINTAFQLYSMTLANDSILQIADKLLFTPDLFNYFLTGRALNEFSIVSTSQLFNHTKHDWADEVFDVLGLPRRLMQKVVSAGSVIGELSEDVVAEVGGKGVKVVAVGSHDTASAVASIEATGDNWAFISSGTWSLMGIKVDKPILTEEAMESDFTNEGTVDGRIRFLRNITGLWLLQNLMKEWEESGVKRTYAELIDEAEQCDFASVVNVDDACFNNPDNMGEAIRVYCMEHGLQVPETQGEFVRCVVLSLAHKYAEVKRLLEKCAGRKIDTIYIVGGGSRNRLLNHLTEQLTGAKVVCGDAEATAVGNIKVQAACMNKF